MSARGRGGHAALAALLTTVAAGLSTVPAAAVQQAPSPQISTYAGGGLISGAPALDVGLALPVATVIAADGTLYFTNGYSIYHYLPATGTMSLVAGDGLAGYTGDGSAALSAQFGFAIGLALDTRGDLYVADAGNNVIRRIDAVSGTITTSVGTGVPGYSGDNGAAVAATLDGPTGVACDSAGNLYIADSNNNVVRRVDNLSGNIATVVGNGTPGYSGDGAAADLAELNAPARVAVDAAGNLFIVDFNNDAIRRVDAASGNITTVAGNGTAGYSGDTGPAIDAQLNEPSDVALDPSGDLYIADTDNSVIRRVDATSGIITTVAGNGISGYSGDGGPAGLAELSAPSAVALDAAGDLYIADAANSVIRMVSAALTITTVAGNGSISFGGDTGPASAAQLDSPSGVAADGAGNLFIADTFNNAIRRVDAVSGVITTVAGTEEPGYSGDGAAATSAELEAPTAVALDAAGDLYIADAGNCVIRRVDAASGVISTVAGDGNCAFDGDGVVATSAGLAFPLGLAVDAGGNLFIADTDDNRIRRVDAVTGLISTVVGDGNAAYTGDSGPAAAAEVDAPAGVLPDGLGGLYVVDTGNAVVRYVGAGGMINTVVGNGTAGYAGDGGPAASAELSNPTAAALDAGGNLFIADADNDVVRRVDAVSGNISTVAGNGNPGFGGDGAAATSALLAAPTGVAFDAAGNLYIADLENERVRLVAGGGVGSAPPPVVAPVVTGTLGSNGWYTSNVGVAWSVTDAYAPITSRTGCAATSVTTDTAGAIFTCTATSGGTTTQSVTIQREAAAPVVKVHVTPAPNAAGWNTTTPVTVSFTGTSLAGVPANGCTKTISVVTNGASQGESGSCTDVAGNQGFAAVTLNVDTLAPTVSITTPASAASYTQGAPVVANYACADTISGIAICAGGVANGAPINTSAAGPQSFSVTATDLAGNVTTSTVNYTVTPAQPSFSLSPSVLHFPTEEPTLTSPAQAITLKNLGAVPLELKLLKVSFGGVYSDDFTQTNNCGVAVPVGASCTIEVAFTPVSAGMKNDSLLVTAYGATSQSVSLQGLAISPPYTVSPAAIAFPAQAVGAVGATQTLTIANTGALPLVFDGTRITGSAPADFAVKSSTCGASLGVGNSCHLGVAFTAPSGGSKTATLTLEVGGGAIPRQIQLSGTGVVPLYTLRPGSLVFAGQAAGTPSAAKIVTLANAGTVPVPIESIVLGGTSAGDFLLSNHCASTVGVGGNCQIGIEFKPRSKGTKAATLQVTGGGSAGTKDVSLSGVGTAAP